MSAPLPLVSVDCWKLSNELKLAIDALIERPHVNIDGGQKGKRA